MLEEKCAIGAVKVLVGNDSYFPAILALLRHSKSQEKVASTAIRLLLARWSASQGMKQGMQHTDALSNAIELACTYKVSAGLNDTVVRSAAEAGSIHRFPTLPKRLLGRDPNTQEVTLLVSAYVEGKIDPTCLTEVKLPSMVERYLSREDAAIQSERIRKYNMEFEDHIPFD